jgi:hypothetical protein
MGYASPNQFDIRSHLKNRIFVQSQGGLEFQPAGVLQYFEDLKREPNTGFGPKDIFEIGSICLEGYACHFNINIFPCFIMCVWA